MQVRLIILSFLTPLTGLSASDVKPSREAPWTPQETLESIELDGPYEAQLIASEPLVRDPVEMAWDANGNCYVVDMIDYPLGGPEGQPLSRIQHLIDTDGNGSFDEALTFAEELDNAQGLLPHLDGFIVTTRTQILFLRDSNGDGVADERTSLIEGFNPSFSQLQVSSPRWGLDGEVYFNNGLDTREVYPVNPDAPEPRHLDLSRHNLRWNPRTLSLNPASGFGQYGAGFDNWGRHFSCSNRSPVMFAVMPHEAVTRGSSAGLAQGWENIAPHGPDSRVYPLQITHTTSNAHSGTNTSACGLTVYRGHLMPELNGDIFVCDPTGQLITRFRKPKAKGASLVTDRVGQQTEFFRSRDEWCRPVNLTTGPDGALYVCDIYRRYIDHARFFPEEFGKENDLRAGEHHGRIWRIVPKGHPTNSHPITPAPSNVEDLVRWLGHDNAWQRETAQRLLLDRAKDQAKAIEIVPALRDYSEVVQESPLATLHALWTWAGVWAQLPESEQKRLSKRAYFPVIPHSPTPELIENIVIMASRHPSLFKELEVDIAALAFEQGDTRCRMLYLATTEPREDQIHENLNLLLTMIAELEDPWFQGAVLSRHPQHLGQIANRLLASEFGERSSASKVEFIRKLAAGSSASKSVEDFTRLMESFSQKPEPLVWWKAVLMQGLAEGLPKSGGAFGGETLQAFIAHPTETLSRERRELERMLQHIGIAIADSSTPLDQRLACLPLLTQRPYEPVSKLLKDLLSNHHPPELSKAALTTLRRFNIRDTAPLFYEILSTVSPSLRQEMVVALASNGSTVLDLLQRMDRGEVPKSLVDAETRWRLLQSTDPVILPLAEKLFQRPSENRSAVISSYLPSTQIHGDAQKGREIFRTHCMLCHSYQGEGIAVGPDISDVRAKEKEALLSDILDPNRMIEARWSAYQVETADGRTLAGLFHAETDDAVTLRLPGGTQEVIRRDLIVSQRSLDLSLMPEGLEAGIDIQQMADLLAFLGGE